MTFSKPAIEKFSIFRKSRLRAETPEPRKTAHLQAFLALLLCHQCHTLNMVEIPLERHDVSDCIGIINSGLTAEHFGLTAYYLLPDHSVPLVLSRVRFSAIPCP
jgi:hypothetical protein